MRYYQMSEREKLITGYADYILDFEACCENITTFDYTKYMSALHSLDENELIHLDKLLRIPSNRAITIRRLIDTRYTNTQRDDLLYFLAHPDKRLNYRRHVR